MSRSGERTRSVVPIAFRVSKEEQAAVLAAAARAGVTKGEFSRRATLAAAGLAPSAMTCPAPDGVRPELTVDYDV